MARIHGSRIAPPTSTATARHRAEVRKTKPSYKVVIEQLTEKKRKLVKVLSFNTTAPRGYTFIPAGDPQITSRCKQVAREEGLQVFIVSTSKHHQVNHELSHEVHRVGYHFPSIVVERACSSLGVSLTNSGQVLSDQPIPNTRFRSSRPKKGKKGISDSRDGRIKPGLSQAAVDTEAREAIRDLFPKIPEKDLHQIITRAFKKGKDRVGTAEELSLARRVQLAVVAHIRHLYTDYDLLLRTNDYLVARRKVEQPCLDVLTQWREDEEDDPDAMEDILREVIVIPDDDDEEENHINDHNYSVNQTRTLRPQSRENSVEIVSARPLIHDTIEYALDYGDSGSIPILSRQENSPESRILQPKRRGWSLSGQRQPQSRREESHRQHAWEEARNRRRQNPVVMYPKQWPISQDDWEQIRLAPGGSAPQHIDLTDDCQPMARAAPHHSWYDPGMSVSEPDRALHDTLPAEIHRLSHAEHHARVDHHVATKEVYGFYRPSHEESTKPLGGTNFYPWRNPYFQSDRSHDWPAEKQKVIELPSHDGKHGEIHPRLLDSAFIPTVDGPNEYNPSARGTTRSTAFPMSSTTHVVSHNRFGERCRPDSDTLEQDRRIVFLGSENTIRAQARDFPWKSGHPSCSPGLDSSEIMDKSRYKEMISRAGLSTRPEEPPVEFGHQRISTHDSGLLLPEPYHNHPSHSNWSHDIAVCETNETRQANHQFQKIPLERLREPTLPPRPANDERNHGVDDVTKLAPRDGLDRRFVLLPREYQYSDHDVVDLSEIYTGAAPLLLENNNGTITDHRIRLLSGSGHPTRSQRRTTIANTFEPSENAIQSAPRYIISQRGGSKSFAASHSQNPREQERSHFIMSDSSQYDLTKF